ncbi:MAG: BMC domain-containing protein [Suipraeoptans sp.]
MSKAIGMIEYRTVASGITAVDLMVKTSDISIVEAQTVCPGKYIAVVTGDLSAVKVAVDAAKTQLPNFLINSLVLGNPHESIFPAIYAASEIDNVKALGIVETYDATSIILAADEAAKTAIVDLIEMRIARGMCGKSFFLLTGEVAAVQAAVDKAKLSIQESGMFADSSVIANPDPKVKDALL